MEIHYLPTAEIEINVTTRYAIGHMPDMDLHLAHSFTTNFDFASQIVTRDIAWYANASNFQDVVNEIERVLNHE